MKRRVLILILLAVVAGTGCTRKFHLPRGEYPTDSAWRFSRADQSGRAYLATHYSGQLNRRWQKKLSDRPVGPMSIGAGKLVVPVTRGKVHFYDLVSGRHLGRYNSKSNVQSGVAIVDSLAYMALGPKKNRIVCLNLHNLRPVWRAALKDASGPPIIEKNRLYLGSAAGWLECRERMTGEIIWRDSAGARALAGASLYDGIVYFPLDNGIVIGYEAETGTMMFRTDLEEPIVAKAAVGDMLFVAGAEGHFFALERKTGQVVWERLFDWPIWAAPAVDNDMVYIGDNGGFLRALDKRTGRSVWTYKADGVILASPIVVGDYLLFASLDKHLYCLDKKSGLLNTRTKTRHEIRFPAISDGQSIYIATHGGIIQCLGE